MNDQQTKICTKCGEEKPVGEFYSRHGVCKKCHVAAVVAAKQARRAAAAMLVAERDGCRDKESCKSKGPGLCQPCAAARTAALPHVADARTTAARDPKNIRKRITASVQRRREPEYRAGHSARASAWMTSLHLDPEFASRRDANAQKVFASDEGRKRSSSHMTNVHIKRRDNEAFEEIMSEFEREAEFVGPTQEPY